MIRMPRAVGPAETGILPPGACAGSHRTFEGPVLDATLHSRAVEDGVVHVEHRQTGEIGPLARGSEDVS